MMTNEEPDRRKAKRRTSASSPPRNLPLESRRWWAQCRELGPVRGALDRALAERWILVIQAALDRNASAARSPRTWSELAVLMARDRPTLYRWAKGEHRPNVIDLLALATLLGIPLEELIPAAEAWLARATHCVCKGEMTPEACGAYAKWALASYRPRTGDSDQSMTDDRRPGAEVTAVVERLARVMRTLGRKGKHA